MNYVLYIEIIIGFLALAALHWILRRREKRLDASVALTLADYEYSVFRAHRWVVGALWLVGIFSMACGVSFFVFTGGTTGFRLLGGGLMSMLLGSVKHRERIEFRNWTILARRGKKLQWELDIAEIEKITRFDFGSNTLLYLKSARGKKRSISVGDYMERHKLRVMILDSKRAYEDARLSLSRRRGRCNRSRASGVGQLGACADERRGVVCVLLGTVWHCIHRLPRLSSPPGADDGRPPLLSGATPTPPGRAA